MTDFRDSSLVDAVLSLDDGGRDEQGRELLFLTLHFETDTVVRFPMGVEVAMRIWKLLDTARKQKGWSEPATPVSTDKLQ
jgi:hypothetical protein